jgi:transcriptional regulator with XRE-family HTH domain
LLTADKIGTTSDMEVNVGRVKELRAERVMSLRELSEIAGVSKDTIWRLESGTSTNAHPSTIRKLAKALGVEPTELTKRSADAG